MTSERVKKIIAIKEVALSTKSEGVGVRIGSKNKPSEEMLEVESIFRELIDEGAVSGNSGMAPVILRNSDGCSIHLFFDSGKGLGVDNNGNTYGSYISVGGGDRGNLLRINGRPIIGSIETTLGMALAEPRFRSADNRSKAEIERDEEESRMKGATGVYGGY